MSADTSSFFPFDAASLGARQRTNRDHRGATRSQGSRDALLTPIWKTFGAAHKAVYLGSGGRVGAKLGWMPMLLLSTRGRKSGLIRTMPLAYLPDPLDEDRCVVVASNGGSERPPAWWLNLQADDVATVQVGRESFLARARLAEPARRASLWSELRATIPPYRAYEKIEREIPIVLLERLPAGER